MSLQVCREGGLTVGEALSLGHVIQPRLAERLRRNLD